MAKSKTVRAPSSIDPTRAVSVKDLLSSFESFQTKVLKRFPEPPSRTATSKSAGEAVTTGVKKGWGIQYTKKGIPGYWRLRKKMEGVWDELTSMHNLAQYVKLEPVLKLATGGSKKGKKGKKSA